ncbi:hypothetical protein A5N15_00375 [Rothia kristinae]|uniref:Glycoside hydrolase family 65 N-terminal domain-containing protein n=1 Tax=Rothia kristinae TaxID=37923 RepID=A0A657IW30_9MICC|nr:hypothetical protein A5N15_00375 [Rothia kristinae]
MQGQAALKNDYFQAQLDEHGVEIFRGTVDFARRVKEGGTGIALVTASRNSRTVLAAAGLEDLFPIIIDGGYALEHGIPGKPAPDMFLAAARALEVDPADAVVIEDAVSGVQAGKAGGFGLVVGINRHGDRADLEEAGADVVHNDVAELDLGLDRTDSWKLIYRGFDPKHEAHREALLTLANGYMGVRGARPEHGGRRDPLPRHLRRRDLQPGGLAHQRPGPGARVHGQPAQLRGARRPPSRRGLVVRGRAAHPG